ncbi:LLM class F420-dependent oxidoreductase [Nonomuraea cavernae]|uniref:LLM class F420-dependent oxidoreductase n=1 Tax=Nonomuraea cavernae TaxID=2045107 RepID=A0A917ZGH6_9ACTN|nr:LLM class F420-dependent oxidoreductase [Nonomuraea cavernae]MCA2186442.1 LLM class F420-dependent oxidoreductase [Nonomuraea cavernae]GGO82698.1 LLM class F420-dependent oxidoreductase [Nonomuraea cavernae]
MSDLKLGLALGYWGAGPPPGLARLVTAAERLGYDSMWAAEAYGSDALTPLAWLGATTRRMRLGTSIVQMAARTPVATAMAAMTLDHLSGGRFVLGLGASGPQVVEGWYGQPYPRPLARTREYVAILRQVLAREKVSFDGEHYRLPHPGGSGLGKPLRSTIHPLRPHLPILLAAEGPKNVALAAEIADGWLAMFYSPYDDAYHRDALQEGFARRGATPDSFEVTCRVNVELDDDVEAAADRVRPMLALYVGGMGAKGANFHYQAFARMGFEAECARVQELYLGGRKAEAAAAIPLAMVEKVALVGPREKIAEELAAWRSSLVTTMLVSGDEARLAAIADLVHG